MPEYRRFIAYFYEYIEGKKQKNAGFAKVELRNGMWRILFRLTTPCRPAPPVQVYGFVRERGYLLGLLMGTMHPGSTLMEDWAYQADTPIWKRKYGLEQLSGIWIRSGDGKCYVTVWDDEPIRTEKFVLELPEEAFEEEHRLEPKREAEKEQEAEVAAAEVAVSAEAEMKTETEAAVVREEAERETKTEAAAVVSAAAEMEAKIEISAEPKRETETAREIQAEITVSAELERETEAEIAISAESEREIVAEAAVSAELERKTEATVKETVEMKKAETEADEEKEAVAAQSAFGTADLWEELFRRRQHFEPFGDNEFSNCIQIMPCDLIRLQQQGWQVGRSSFLLHGFYQYHHLLFGTTADDSYVLGVPGILNPQERYMAQMFGFSIFKTTGCRGYGRPSGYWCRILPRLQPSV